MKKLIIEISDDDYNLIQSFEKECTNYPITLRLYEAVKNSSEFDDICKSLTYNQDLYDYIQERADEKHVSVSDMIRDMLWENKVRHGKPDVKIGDRISYRDAVAVIKDIVDDTWEIEWETVCENTVEDVTDDKLDHVPPLLQHNWKKV